MRPVIYRCLIFFCLFLCSFSASGATFDNSKYESLKESLIASKSPASYRDIISIYELSRDYGLDRTIKFFDEYLLSLQKSKAEGAIIPFVQIISDELKMAKPFYKGITQWKVSGPWKRYGQWDLEYQFPVERSKDFNNFSSEDLCNDSGKLYPLYPDKEGVYYLAFSFSVDKAFRLFIQSNSRYRLFVNNSIVLKDCALPFEAMEFKSGGNYTVIIKMNLTEYYKDPFVKVILTDLQNNEILPLYCEKRFIESFPLDSLVCLTEETGNLQKESSGIEDLLRGASSFEEKLSIALNFSSANGDKADGYYYLLPMLEESGNEAEFLLYLNKYRENFPDSSYYLKWLCDFYSKRDLYKFKEAAKNLPVNYFNSDIFDLYCSLLLIDKDNQRVLTLSNLFEEIPSFTKKALKFRSKILDREEYRNYLLNKASLSNCPFYFYELGRLDMEKGLDPVLYWEKSLSKKWDRKIWESREIYEHSGKGYLYYTPKYETSEFNFKRGGVKRNISIKIFPEGNYFIHCEDYIPVSEFKGSAKLLNLSNLHILYVIIVKDNTVHNVGYQLDMLPGQEASLSIMGSASGDFVVISYSGFFPPDRFPFYIIENFTIKMPEENLSEISLEITTDIISPEVVLDGEKLKFKERDGILFIQENKRSIDSSSTLLLSAGLFNLQDRFAGWYDNLVSLLGDEIDLPVNSESKDLKDIVPGLKNFLDSYFLINGNFNFEPQPISEIIRLRSATSEELAIMALKFLKKRDIISFICFVKSPESKDRFEDVGLYIPDSQGAGYFLFFGDKDFSGRDALLLKGNSSMTIQVKEK